MNTKPSPYAWAGMKYRPNMGKSTVTQELIIDVVCNYYKVPFEIIQVRTRTRALVEIRYVIMHLCKKHTDLTLKLIGRIFEMDHTTVIHGLESIQDRIDTEPELKDMIDALSHQIIYAQYQSLDPVPVVSNKPFKTVILGY